MELENLVVLTYLHINRMTVTKASEMDKLTVDLVKRTWTYQVWQDVPVGQARKRYYYNKLIRHDIIGVYDVTDKSHLDNMVQAAISFACDK